MPSSNPRNRMRETHERRVHEDERQRRQRGLLDRVKAHPLVALLLTAAALVGAATTLWQPLKALDRSVMWRSVEEHRIESLHKGETVELLRAKFGPPEEVTPYEGLKIFEWRKRGYDVRAAVADAAVSSYLVHVCDESLKPSLTTGAMPDVRVTANSSTFSSLADVPQFLFYNWAPAFEEYWEGVTGSHAESFRDRYWGYWPCGGEFTGWHGRGSGPPPLLCTASPAPNCMNSHFKSIPFRSALIQDMRKNLTINTIGEARLGKRFPPPEVRSIPPSRL